MTPAEHGGQHGVFVAAQRGQASGEVCAPHVQRNDLRKLQTETNRWNILLQDVNYDFCSCLQSYISLSSFMTIFRVSAIVKTFCLMGFIAL